MLLPDPASLEIKSVTADESQANIVVNLVANQPTATCPLCHQTTDDVHSHYQRTLADLPWAALAVKLQVQVRRFFCHTEGCPRWIFTERLPQVAVPWARRTVRLANVQQEIGLAVGASMGSRLAEKLAMPVSIEVVLCLVRQTEIVTGQPVRVLGVDDWAMRKGHIYGTILIDLEKGEPIDLLPDRRAETLTAWLKEHPEVEIISRDRAGAYAEGATQGAPTAVQVADRWHLLHNLGDALVRVLEKYQRPLDHLPTESQANVATSVETPLATAESAEVVVSDSDKKQRPSILERQARHRADRLVRFEEVRTLYAQGATISAIAHQTGLDRKTVRRFITADTFPERQAPPQRVSILDPYKPYLRQRWQEGCRTAAKLWRELQAQGYRGGRVLVVEFVAQLRKAYRLALTPAEATAPRLTPRIATWVILKRPDEVEAKDRSLVERVRALHPDVDAAITLAQDFATIIRTHLLADFDPWLARATSSSIAALRNFAVGIQRDYAAVKAAITTDWSNGPVEGQVNRLKFIKRQMFGRAHFDLLRKRVLYNW
jgi:transposase